MRRQPSRSTTKEVRGYPPRSPRCRKANARHDANHSLEPPGRPENVVFLCVMPRRQRERTRAAGTRVIAPHFCWGGLRLCLTPLLPVPMGRPWSDVVFSGVVVPPPRAAPSIACSAARPGCSVAQWSGAWQRCRPMHIDKPACHAEATTSGNYNQQMHAERTGTHPRTHGRTDAWTPGCMDPGRTEEHDGTDARTHGCMNTHRRTQGRTDTLTHGHTTCGRANALTYGRTDEFGRIDEQTRKRMHACMQKEEQAHGALTVGHTDTRARTQWRKRRRLRESFTHLSRVAERQRGAAHKGRHGQDRQMDGPRSAAWQVAAGHAPGARGGGPTGPHPP